MTSYFKLGAGVLLLTTMTACATVPPLCDREAQEWTKYGTQEDQCAVEPRREAPEGPKGNLGGDTPETDLPPLYEPPSEEEEEEEEEGGKTKGNNGWGNGDQDAPGKSGPHNNAENKED